MAPTPIAHFIAGQRSAGPAVMPVVLMPVWLPIRVAKP